MTYENWTPTVEVDESVLVEAGDDLLSVLTFWIAMILLGGSIGWLLAQFA